MTVGEFRHKLEKELPTEQKRLLGKLMREARDTDVWVFTSPTEVWQRWPEITKYLGRRRAFWEFLFSQWQKEGLITP